jgi:hypothetical protein
MSTVIILWVEFLSSKLKQYKAVLIRLVLGSKGKLASAYAKHCRQIAQTAEKADQRGHYESPKQLKQSIVSKFTQFAGRQQHDSQELLVSTQSKHQL